MLHNSRWLLFTELSLLSSHSLFGLSCSVVTLVKHLLTPPLQGVCICMCIPLVQPLYCRRSIWMESAAHWRFTTSYEKARWQDICLRCSARQKDETRGQRGASGKTRVSRNSSWFQLWVGSGHSQTSERRVRCWAQQGTKETHFHAPPPQGSIKSFLHREAAKHQIIYLMAGVADFLTNFCAHCFP